MTTFVTRKQDDESDLAVFGSSGGGVRMQRAKIDNNGSGAITRSGSARRPARLRFHDRHLEIARATLAEATDRINVLD
jgi:hypothetical protein